MAAVAHFSLSHLKLAVPSTLPSPHLVNPQDDTTFVWPLRILAHDTGKVFTAHVPVEVVPRLPDERSQNHIPTFRPTQEGNSQIAGVPGSAPGITIESPLVGSILPTANQRDTIEFEGKRVSKHICTAGK